MATDMRNEEAIAKLDVYRARRIGQMLVGAAEPAYEEDPDLLIDVEAQDAKQLLDEYVRDFSKFGTTPFDPDGKRLKLFPGGLTIWSGFPGAGKTTLLRQFVCHCLHRGSAVFLASLEEHPKRLLVNLAATAAGAQMPTAHQLQWFIDAYGKRFRLWAKVGVAQHRQLLGVIRKCAEGGVRHAVIDSLMCLDVANDDFEAQRRFANLLAVTARAANVHIHLVAHPRKLLNASQDLDLNDVAGARELGGIADNVIFVRRSKDADTDPGMSAMGISIRKQRHGTGELGNIAGWLHKGYRQFHLVQFQQVPTRYLPEDAYV
jgi:twinkle protein